MWLGPACVGAGSPSFALKTFRLLGLVPKEVTRARQSNRRSSRPSLSGIDSFLEIWQARVMGVARRKTALYLDEKLMQSAKLMAVASGKHDYEVIEEALLEYVTARRGEADGGCWSCSTRSTDARSAKGLPTLSDEEANVVGKELRVVRAGRGRQT